MITKWIIKNPDEKAVRELVTGGGLSPLAAKALAAEGIDTIEKAADLFGDNGGDDMDMGFADPFTIRDMSTACRIISDAVDSGALICVYGDYDCDGVTAAAVLSSYLTDIGGRVITYINERSEGYGMNCAAVRKLHEQGTELIVTVDNGISALAEADLCAELGITLVITDHHQPGERLPAAAAVVDPHRSDCPSIYKNYCGCGLVLKLIAAMEDGDMERAVEQYSDLAAIATVADVVPLTGENRRIVSYGLHFLENTENIGLKALIEKAGIKPPYTSFSAAFALAPRINAAGRIGSPSDALRLLVSEDAEDAEETAEKICGLNVERRNYEKAIICDISEIIKNDPSVLDKRVLVFSGQNWHHGVIGIAAAKCTERFGKPVFLMSAYEGESEIRGSARSIKGFNVFKALENSSSCLLKYGGHSGAGGFSLEREQAAEFDRRLQEYAQTLANEGTVCRPSVDVCAAVCAADLTVEAVSGLDVLEPFGEGNPKPVFLLSDCVISDIIPLSEGAHTKLMLSSGGTVFAGLMFGMKTAELPFKKGDAVNALVSPGINSRSGRKTVDLRISDIRRKGLNQSALIAAEEVYFAFRRGERLDSRLIPKIIPERKSLAEVYRAAGKDKVSVLGLYSRVGSENMNYCKFLLCLDIFSESGLIDYDRFAGQVRIIPGAPKADTEAAPTMARLRAL